MRLYFGYGCVVHGLKLRLNDHCTNFFTLKLRSESKGQPNVLLEKIRVVKCSDGIETFCIISKF